MVTEQVPINTNFSLLRKERAAGTAVRSELRASVDAKVQAAVTVKEALAQVADALECACCLERLAPGAAVALECGHTCNPVIRTFKLWVKRVGLGCSSSGGAFH